MAVAHCFCWHFFDTPRAIGYYRVFGLLAQPLGSQSSNPGFEERVAHDPQTKAGNI
jgi:hypothetical protein